MSGYAILAQAWGAEVSGWDRRETPYLEGVRAAGIPVEISDGPPGAPADAGALVSSALRRRGGGGPREAFVPPGFGGRGEGAPGAELLGELVALADSIVVAGAHGKTTTTAM